MNKCYYCFSEKELMCYGKDRFVCRTCNRDKSKKYRQTEKGKKSIKKARAKQKKLHIEKYRAVRKIGIRVHKGTIIKPKHCCLCQSKKEIQAHHPDYSRPLWVMWVCRNCHVCIHKPNSTINTLSYMIDYDKIKS